MDAEVRDVAFLVDKASAQIVALLAETLQLGLQDNAPQLVHFVSGGSRRVDWLLCGPLELHLLFYRLEVFVGNLAPLSARAARRRCPGGRVAQCLRVT